MQKFVAKLINAQRKLLCADETEKNALIVLVEIFRNDLLLLYLRQLLNNLTAVPTAQLGNELSMENFEAPS